MPDADEITELLRDNFGTTTYPDLPAERQLLQDQGIPVAATKQSIEQELLRAGRGSGASRASRSCERTQSEPSSRVYERREIDAQKIFSRVYICQYAAANSGCTSPKVRKRESYASMEDRHDCT